MTETEYLKIKQQRFIPIEIFLSNELRQSELAYKAKLRRDAETAVREQRATFDDLVTLEPALQWLMDDAVAYRKSHGKKKTCCANSRWYV